MGWRLGIDEVGRGPLAGPVVAACVPDLPELASFGVDDSKRLRPKQRQQILQAMDEAGVPRGIGEADPGEIDQMGILQATFLAMERALADIENQTGQRATELLVDGNQDPQLGRPTQCIVGGDAEEPSIAAASIVAKEYRDAAMVRLGQRYPGYGLERNAGYPTAEHLAGLQAQGTTPEHRLSFAPVRRAVVAGRHHRGREAEDRALAELELSGLELVARNWRGRRGELDLVFRDGEELAVVEVRSRSDGIDPLETLTSGRKWNHILRATEELIQRLRLQHLAVRFDVVAVSGAVLEWHEDAWRPLG
ncbi:MAG: ribonuclease HII [Myxococcales bacterium]|nr:ribonuclease HII [Myxococcales bacterium]